MRKLLIIIALAATCAACNRPEREKEAEVPSEDFLLRTTPLMEQGDMPFCWIYAMLACIETYRMECYNDSVRLAPDFLISKLRDEQRQEKRLLHGKRRVSEQGMGPDALRLIQHYGLMPYNTRSGRKGGFYLYGMHYTPQEFGRSVYVPGEWKWYTSFTHHPYGETFALEVPDNHHYNEFLNVPVDSLLTLTVNAVRHRRPVFWEGCMKKVNPPRQFAFEHNILTDDHAMAIVGLGKTKGGKPCFILKNSYGSTWGNKGYAKMSFQAFRQRTLAIGIPEGK